MSCVLSISISADALLSERKFKAITEWQLNTVKRHTTRWRYDTKHPIKKPLHQPYPSTHSVMVLDIKKSLIKSECNIRLQWRIHWTSQWLYELHSANSWRGKHQSGQAIKTKDMPKKQKPHHDESEDWQPSLEDLAALLNRGLLRSNDKGLVSTPYKSVTMGRGFEGWGLISCSIFWPAAWSLSLVKGSMGWARLPRQDRAADG